MISGGHVDTLVGGGSPQESATDCSVTLVGLRAMLSSRSGSIDGTSVTVIWIPSSAVERHDRALAIAMLDNISIF